MQNDISYPKLVLCMNFVVSAAKVVIGRDVAVNICSKNIDSGSLLIRSVSKHPWNQTWNLRIALQTYLSIAYVDIFADNMKKWEILKRIV